MKIAKLNSSMPGSIIHGINSLDYYLVSNNYNFELNNSTDVTSVRMLETFYGASKIEYGVYRDSLKTLFVPNWVNLTFDEKKLCVKEFCYPSDITNEEWLTYYSFSEHESNWLPLVISCREYRQKRLFAAFTKLTYYCTVSQTAVIYMTVKTMCIDYYYGNLPHLVLWISNGSYPALGVDFTNSGFAQASGYTTQLRDSLLDIFINGNY